MGFGKVLTYYSSAWESLFNEDLNSDHVSDFYAAVCSFREALTCCVCLELIRVKDALCPSECMEHFVCQGCVGKVRRNERKCRLCDDWSTYKKDDTLTNIIRSYSDLCLYFFSLAGLEEILEPFNAKFPVDCSNLFRLMEEGYSRTDISMERTFVQINSEKDRNNSTTNVVCSPATDPIHSVNNTSANASKPLLNINSSPVPVEINCCSKAVQSDIITECDASSQTVNDSNLENVETSTTNAASTTSNILNTSKVDNATSVTNVVTLPVDVIPLSLLETCSGSVEISIQKSDVNSDSNNTIGSSKPLAVTESCKTLQTQNKGTSSIVKELANSNPATDKSVKSIDSRELFETSPGVSSAMIMTSCVLPSNSPSANTLPLKRKFDGAPISKEANLTSSSLNTEFSTKVSEISATSINPAATETLTPNQLKLLVGTSAKGTATVSNVSTTSETSQVETTLPTNIPNKSMSSFPVLGVRTDKLTSAHPTPNTKITPTELKTLTPNATKTQTHIVTSKPVVTTTPCTQPTMSKVTSSKPSISVSSSINKPANQGIPSNKAVSIGPIPTVGNPFKSTSESAKRVVTGSTYKPSSSPFVVGPTFSKTTTYTAKKSPARPTITSEKSPLNTSVVGSTGFSGGSVIPNHSVSSITKSKFLVTSSLIDKQVSEPPATGEPLESKNAKTVIPSVQTPVVSTGKTAVSSNQAMSVVTPSVCPQVDSNKVINYPLPISTFQGNKRIPPVHGTATHASSQVISSTPPVNFSTQPVSSQVTTSTPPVNSQVTSSIPPVSSQLNFSTQPVSSQKSFAYTSQGGNQRIFQNSPCARAPPVTSQATSQVSGSSGCTPFVGNQIVSNVSASNQPFSSQTIAKVSVCTPTVSIPTISKVCASTPPVSSQTISQVSVRTSLVNTPSRPSVANVSATTPPVCSQTISQVSVRTSLVGTPSCPTVTNVSASTPSGSSQTFAKVSVSTPPVSNQTIPKVSVCTPAASSQSISQVFIRTPTLTSINQRHPQVPVQSPTVSNPAGSRLPIHTTTIGNQTISQVCVRTPPVYTNQNPLSFNPVPAQEASNTRINLANQSSSSTRTTTQTTEQQTQEAVQHNPTFSVSSALSTTSLMNDVVWTTPSSSTFASSGSVNMGAIPIKLTSNVLTSSSLQSPVFQLSGAQSTGLIRLGVKSSVGQQYRLANSNITIPGRNVHLIPTQAGENFKLSSDILTAVGGVPRRKFIVATNDLYQQYPDPTKILRLATSDYSRVPFNPSTAIAGSGSRFATVNIRTMASGSLVRPTSNIPTTMTTFSRNVNEQTQAVTSTVVSVSNQPTAVQMPLSSTPSTSVESIPGSTGVAVLRKAAVTSSNSSTTPSPTLKRKLEGCRCGNTTNNPGKLTCIGQRCACYSDGNACSDCKCKGCKNPYVPGSDGQKVLHGVKALLDPQTNQAIPRIVAGTFATIGTTSNGSAVLIKNPNLANSGVASHGSPIPITGTMGGPIRTASSGPMSSAPHIQLIPVRLGPPGQTQYIQFANGNIHQLPFVMSPTGHFQSLPGSGMPGISIQGLQGIPFASSSIPTGISQHVHQPKPTDRNPHEGNV